MGKVTELSASNLLPGLNVDSGRWNRMPSEEEIAATAEALEKNAKIKVIRGADGDEALQKIKELIPAGAEVMNGSSTTLIEIGYQDFVRSDKSPWKNLRQAIDSESDPARRDELRRRSIIADYFLSGVNAISKTGMVAACDATGSRTGAWLFGARNLILVSGVNKIVSSEDEALQRIKEYAYPLEDARINRAQGAHSSVAKCAMIRNERKKGRVTLILINDRLGY
ncbi:MAG TPA: lactate utilization protein [Methanotrichaceae archaeon]|nr:lactate utilization protein [Methanotrichaceae archaeon]